MRCGITYIRRPHIGYDKTRTATDATAGRLLYVAHVAKARAKNPGAWWCSVVATLRVADRLRTAETTPHEHRAVDYTCRNTLKVPLLL